MSSKSKKDAKKAAKNQNPSTTSNSSPNHPESNSATKNSNKTTQHLNKTSQDSQTSGTSDINKSKGDKGDNKQNVMSNMQSALSKCSNDDERSKLIQEMESVLSKFGSGNKKSTWKEGKQSFSSDMLAVPEKMKTNIEILGNKDSQPEIINMTELDSDLNDNINNITQTQSDNVLISASEDINSKPPSTAAAVLGKIHTTGAQTASASIMHASPLPSTQLQHAKPLGLSLTTSKPSSEPAESLSQNTNQIQIQSQSQSQSVRNSAAMMMPNANSTNGYQGPGSNAHNNGPTIMQSSDSSSAIPGSSQYYSNVAASVQTTIAAVAVPGFTGPSILDPLLMQTGPILTSYSCPASAVLCHADANHNVINPLHGMMHGVGPGGGPSQVQTVTGNSLDKVPEGRMTSGLSQNDIDSELQSKLGGARGSPLSAQGSPVPPGFDESDANYGLGFNITNPLNSMDSMSSSSAIHQSFSNIPPGSGGLATASGYPLTGLSGRGGLSYQTFLQHGAGGGIGGGGGPKSAGPILHQLPLSPTHLNASYVRNQYLNQLNIGPGSGISQNKKSQYGLGQNKLSPYAQHANPANNTATATGSGTRSASGSTRNSPVGENATSSSQPAIFNYSNMIKKKSNSPIATSANNASKSLKNQNALPLGKARDGTNYDQIQTQIDSNEKLNSNEKTTSAPILQPFTQEMLDAVKDDKTKITKLSQYAREAIDYKEKYMDNFQACRRVCGNPLCRRKWKQLTYRMSPLFCPTCRKTIEHNARKKLAETSVDDNDTDSNSIVKPRDFVEVLYTFWYDCYLDVCENLNFPLAEAFIETENYFTRGPDVPPELAIAEQQFYIGEVMMKNFPMLDANSDAVKNWNSMLARKKYYKGKVIKKTNFLCEILAVEELDNSLVNTIDHKVNLTHWFLDFRQSLQEGDVFPFVSFPNPSVAEREFCPRFTKLIRDTEDDGEENSPVTGQSSINQQVLLSNSTALTGRDNLAQQNQMNNAKGGYGSNQAALNKDGQGGKRNKKGGMKKSNFKGPGTESLTKGPIYPNQNFQNNYDYRYGPGPGDGKQGFFGQDKGKLNLIQPNQNQMLNFQNPYGSNGFSNSNMKGSFGKNFSGGPGVGPGSFHMNPNYNDYMSGPMGPLGQPANMLMFPTFNNMSYDGGKGGFGLGLGPGPNNLLNDSSGLNQNLIQNSHLSQSNFQKGSSNSGIKNDNSESADKSATILNQDIDSMNIPTMLPDAAFSDLVTWSAGINDTEHINHNQSRSDNYQSGQPSSGDAPGSENVK